MKYRDSKWLEQQIVAKKRLYKDIANECGVTKGTVMVWSKKFGIRSPNKGCNYFTAERNPNKKLGEEYRDILLERYCNRGERISDIAKELGVSENPLYRVIREYNLPKFDFINHEKKKRQERIKSKMKEIEAKYGYFSYALAYKYRIADSIKHDFDGSFMNTCLEIGVKFKRENFNEFFAIGIKFEQVVADALTLLGVRYKYQESISNSNGILRPDFILDGNEWLDSKLTTYTIRDTKVIDKYLPNCHYLYLVYLFGEQSDISPLEGVEVIDIRDLIELIHSPYKRAIFYAAISDIEDEYYRALRKEVV